MTHFIYYIFSALFSLGLFLILDALRKEWLLQKQNYARTEYKKLNSAIWQNFLALDLRKVLGLTVFQNSIIIFYLALGKKENCHHPILTKELTAERYCAPLPHVLMLTAIVVGFAVLCVALAISYSAARVRKEEPN